MFLSIITPFYNCFGIIKKCISSLEQQSCRDFELILIDDASTDISTEQLDQLVQSADISIHLLHNDKNHGPGYSRNRGIHIAQGDYLLFLDSDDWLHDNAIHILKQLISKHEYDCIIFDYFIVSSGQTLRSTVERRKQGELKWDDALLYSSGSVCCKLYRSSIIIENNITFPDIYIKEDMVFNKLALSCCKNIFYLEEGLYYYNIHPNSLMHSEKAYDVRNDIIAFQVLVENLSQYPDILTALMLRELLYAGTLHMLCSGSCKKDVSAFVSEIKNRYPGCLTHPYITELPFRMRLFLFGIKHRLWKLLYIMAYLKIKCRR